MTVTAGERLTDNDMDIMRIIHNAFRRDGARLTRAAERHATMDPATRDALLAGWRSFSSSLHHHHTLEDTNIWPRLRVKLTGRPDDLAVLDAMQAEHALIDPTLAALDTAFTDPDATHEEVAARIGEVVGLLTSHLGHEEKDAFPLIRGWLTTREWAQLNKDAYKQLSLRELAMVGPFLLDGAPPEDVRRTLAELPPPLRLVYRYWWNPRYHRVRRWE